MDKQKILVGIINESSDLRGKLITRVSILESYIDLFLTGSFSPDEEFNLPLLEMVIATRHLSFDSKRDILLNILQVKHPTLKKKHTSLSKDLQEIARQRNIFAHYTVSGNEKDIQGFEKDKSVCFLRHQHSVKPVVYSKKEYSALVALIDKNVKILQELLELADTPFP